MNGLSRPFHPPALTALVADEDGSAAARLRAEERIRSSALEAGRLRGLEEGLAQGRAEGREAGRAEAAREAEAELARRGLHGAAAVAAALERLLQQRAEDRRLLDADLRAALVAALEAVFPALLARAAGGEVAALLAEALTERAADTITLRAHPATLAAAQKDGLPGLDAPARLRLLPDPGLPEGQAEAGWADGGLLYDPAALMARVLAVLGAAAPMLPPDLLPAAAAAGPAPGPGLTVTLARDPPATTALSLSPTVPPAAPEETMP
jgi:flagellar biosynthesis/type III secretory pathway protein FliH